MTNEDSDTGEHDHHSENAAEPPTDWSSVAPVISGIRSTSDENEIQELFRKHIDALAKLHGVDDYNILLLHDERDDITHWHSDRIYKGANAFPEKKSIFLLIHSRGGRVEPAYLISKTCKRLSSDRFIAAVPRKAKSAATLISLGADEIHMGLMSELGPIDPQFGGLPALGIQNALSVLAELCCEYPGASDMLGKYLAEKLDPNVLGYFNRVTQSATQYAERLLQGKDLPNERTPRDLGEHFATHYKDHSFVIDADEATELLGENVVRQGTREYQFANAVYESLDFIEFVMKILVKQQFDYVGSIKGGLSMRQIKD